MRARKNRKKREREKTCLLLHRVKVGILSSHAHDQNSNSQILIMQTSSIELNIIIICSLVQNSIENFRSTRANLSKLVF
jgi:hypothetical protein